MTSVEMGGTAQDPSSRESASFGKQVLLGEGAKAGAGKGLIPGCSAALTTQGVG